jgi:hypothetical protein
MDDVVVAPTLREAELGLTLADVDELPAKVSAVVLIDPLPVVTTLGSTSETLMMYAAWAAGTARIDSKTAKRLRVQR